MIKVKRAASPVLKDIQIDINQRSAEQQAGQAKLLGYNPLIYYNGVFIAPEYIESMEINCKNFVPELRIIFKDKNKALHNEGFALDNTIISVYIDSRTKDVDTVAGLRGIRIDFKISQFNFMEDDMLFYVVGIMNVDWLYTPTIYSIDATSYETLEDMAQKGKLGFSSNVSNTNDKQVWINTDFRNYLFMQDVTRYAYRNDNSFFHSFIDFYYNLNFVDVEAQFKDTATVKGILSSVSKGALQEANLTVQDLYLVNKGTAEGLYNNTIETYDVKNASTSTSLNSGYRTELYYYHTTGNWGQLAGTFFKFTIDTLTEGKGIVLKSSPGDKGKGSFFEQNVRKVYESPICLDNMHEHYSYAGIQNELNLNDMHKVTMYATLSFPNFNFYKFQQIPVFIMDYDFGRSGGSSVNRRLTGNWLIVDITFTYNGSDGLTQQLTLIRRELGA